MKKIVLALIIMSVLPVVAWASCDNPCGPRELMECKAAEKDMTAEEFFYKAFYSEGYNDKGCKGSVEAILQEFGADNPKTYFRENYCKDPGAYFTYENFITAAESFPEFMCSDKTNATTKFQELAAFFATVSQETKVGPEDATNDGMGNRYEADHLPATMDGHNVYYQQIESGAWAVYSTTGGIDGDTKTDMYWSGSNCDAEGKQCTGLVFHTDKEDSMWVKYEWQSFETPDGYKATSLLDIIEPAYWIGMGPKQLTADSMMGFFGWYYQHLAEGAPVEKANYKAFVEKYLNDGLLAFQGAIWYWTKRVSGQEMPTIASVYELDKPLCHDIAMVTRAVNGACNHYSGRRNYYLYNVKSSNALDIQGWAATKKTVEIPGKGMTMLLDSMECSEDLAYYCGVQKYYPPTADSE